MNEHQFSDRRLKILIVLAFLIIGWLCFRGAASGHAQPAPADLSPGVQEVIKLTKAHMTDDVILAYIHNSGAAYNLSANDILFLNGQGVSQPVISALLQAKSSAASAPSPAPAPAPSYVPPPQTAPPSYAPQVNPPGEPGTPAPPVSESAEGPQPGSAVTLPYFQAQLSPYGTWTDIPGYGTCWIPSVQHTVPDWRPYLNDGHWEYTEQGWFWHSDYPWGEYAFHYGRWIRDPRWGWAWIPGYHWGPGWVCWRNAEDAGYCGWAPLPPGARFETGVGLVWNGQVAVNVDFGLAPDMFVYVPFDHFWAHSYIPFLAPGWRGAELFRHSILANDYRFVGGRFFIGGIGRDRMGFLTHHDVPLGRIDFHDDRIAHDREIQHDRGMDMHGGRDFHGDHRDGDHHGF
ncbi:MAG TPA: DUF6600 domain-containing protein [Verrucomicrobiae bacterium]|nr:DUF6600 domain-containing protein [Verrucomicrobiae bacterium]